MTALTLSTAQAGALYARGLAFLDTTFTLTTRTGIYGWDATAQCYELLHGDLRVQHSLGCTWNGTRFVRCHCDTCRRFPETTAQIDLIADPFPEETQP